MQADATLRRDSWVNLAQTFVVEATMIKSYDHKVPSLHYKLTPSSMNDVCIVLGLPCTWEELYNKIWGRTMRRGS